MSNDEMNRKIHIDDDWKAQAERDKEKLAEELEAAEAGHGPGQLPQADFQTIVSTLVTQVLMYLGAVPDPMSGQRVLHLDLAKHHIDLLGVLEEKTKGNLTKEEGDMLTQALVELRQAFVHMAARLGEHMKADQNKQAPAAEPGKKPAADLKSPPPKKSSGIIMP